MLKLISKTVRILRFIHCLLPWMVRLDGQTIYPLGWLHHQQNMQLSSTQPRLSDPLFSKQKSWNKQEAQAWPDWIQVSKDHTN